MRGSSDLANFWAMAMVAATAIVVGLWRSILFLVLTAVFSFYARKTQMTRQDEES